MQYQSVQDISISVVKPTCLTVISSQVAYIPIDIRPSFSTVPGLARHCGACVGYGTVADIGDGPNGPSGRVT